MTDVLTDRPEIPGHLMSASDFLGSPYLNDFFSKIPLSPALVSAEGIELPVDKWIAVADRLDRDRPDIPTLRSVVGAALDDCRTKAYTVANEIEYTFGSDQAPSILVGISLEQWTLRKFFGENVSRPSIIISRDSFTSRLPEADARKIPPASTINITGIGIDQRGEQVVADAAVFLQFSKDTTDDLPAIFIRTTKRVNDEPANI